MTKVYYTVLNLVALSLTIYIGVNIFYRIVSSGFGEIKGNEIVMEQAPNRGSGSREPLRNYKSITERNLFGSRDTAAEVAKEAEIENVEALEPTSLKLALYGTVTGDRESAFAVIEETDKRKQGLYRIGDSVKDATIKKILREKVVLRVGSRDEILTMEESAASRRKGKPSVSEPVARGSTITVNRQDLESSLQDISKILSEVRIRPHFKDGESDGLSVTRIRPGSIFTKLGLRNGDVVQKIDDKEISSPEDVLGLYEKLKSGSGVSVQISRRNRQRTLNYKFR
jgi:general secretion pathway protein C